MASLCKCPPPFLAHEFQVPMGTCSAHNGTHVYWVIVRTSALLNDLSVQQCLPDPNHLLSGSRNETLGAHRPLDQAPPTTAGRVTLVAGVEVLSQELGRFALEYETKHLPGVVQLRGREFQRVFTNRKERRWEKARNKQGKVMRA